MPHLRVAFVPRWPDNPYQDRLARELGRLGLRVGHDSTLKSILRRARAGEPLPHVLHLHALPPFRATPQAAGRVVMFWWRVLRLRRAGVRVVWTVHNETDHESVHPAIDRALCRWLYRHADAVIHHSAGARQAVESRWGVQPARTASIVHHGHFIGCYPDELAPVDARARLGLPTDELVYLFLGHIRRYKGVVSLVNAFASLAAPRLRLVIAGQPLTSALRSEIDHAIAGCPQITFHPHFVADGELQVYLNAADAVVFPYTKALTSGALILAMSFRKACIAPRMGAIADTLDADGGFLYDPAEPTGLRDALAAAAGAASRLKAMGEYNRRRAEAWGWDAAASRTCAIYQDCLGHDRRKLLSAGAILRRSA